MITSRPITIQVPSPALREAVHALIASQMAEALLMTPRVDIDDVNACWRRFKAEGFGEPSIRHLSDRARAGAKGG